MKATLLFVPFPKIPKMVLDAYDLFVIEDESVPLAKGISNSNHYIFTFAILAVLVLIVAALLITCIRTTYIFRLKELRKMAGEKETKTPYSIKKLKNEISDLEIKMLDKMEVKETT